MVAKHVVTVAFAEKHGHGDWAGLLLAGFAISPTLITLVALTEYLAPAARLTEAWSSTTGAAVGITAGSAVSGWLIDRSGAHTAYRTRHIWSQWQEAPLPS